MRPSNLIRNIVLTVFGAAAAIVPSFALAQSEITAQPHYMQDMSKARADRLAKILEEHRAPIVLEADPNETPYGSVKITLPKTKKRHAPKHQQEVKKALEATTEAVAQATDNLAKAAFAAALVAPETAETPTERVAREVRKELIGNIAELTVRIMDKTPEEIALGSPEEQARDVLFQAAYKGDVGATQVISNLVDLAGTIAKYNVADSQADRTTFMKDIKVCLRGIMEGSTLAGAVADGKLSLKAYSLLTDQSRQAIEKVTNTPPLPKAIRFGGPNTALTKQ